MDDNTNPSIRNIARIRTIKHAAEHIKKMDPETTVGEFYIRQLILSGKLRCNKSGNRYLVDLDRLEEYLANPPVAESDSVKEFGKLRRIQQN